MDRVKFYVTLLTLALLRTSTGSPYLCVHEGEQFKQIPENVSVGSVVEVYQTVGNNSQILLEQKDNEYFYLDVESRNITVRKELDADIGHGTIDFVIICRPVEETSVEVTGGISFIVSDINDNAPVFPQTTYTADISEDAAVGTTVMSKLEASDKDDGEHGRVYYSILPGNYSDHFELRSDSEPFIVLSQTLDYEQVSSITLEILAENLPLGKSKSATATVIFTIQDVNDNGPSFSHPSYTATLQEDADIGSVVPVNEPIHAEDQDRTKADIRYLIAGSEEFEIDEISGVIKVAAPLSAGSITIVLLAHEVNDSLKIDWSVLHIQILETGNKAPVFEPSNYHVIVSELEPVGFTVVTVTARDEDEVHYGLVEPSSFFDIDSEHGTIHLRESLDYETSNSHVLNVTATDGIHTVTTEVVITVADINDNNPQVDMTEVQVEIPRSVGRVVHTIQATDADNGTILSYTMVPNTQLFSVDSNGVITVSGPIEEMIKETYHFLVKVGDNGTPPRETSVLITVKLPLLPTSPRPTTPTSQSGTTEPSEITPAAVTTADTSDMLIIVLGAVAGVLLLVIIVLVIFIKRRRIHYKEQLDKAKIPRSMDPKGLVFKQSPSPQNIPSGHFNYGYDLKSEVDFPSPPENLVESKVVASDSEKSSDDGTTIQENPFSLNGDTVHYQDDNDVSTNNYMAPEESGKLNPIEEIHIQTAVLPMEDDRAYQNLQNGRISTFKPAETDSSENSDSSTGSKKDLWPTPSKKALRFKNPSSESIPSTRMSWQGSEGSVNGRLRNSSKDKPEITVYF